MEVGEYDTFVGKKIRIFLRTAIYDDEHDITTYDVSGICVLDGIREIRILDEDTLYSIPKDNIVAIRVEEE